MIYIKTKKYIYIIPCLWYFNKYEDGLLGSPDYHFKDKGVNFMKSVITVIGKDKVGIIAKISTLLADNNVNILDISQTIMQDMFTMIMMVDIKESAVDFYKLSESLEKLGEEIGVSIRIQHEDIFKSMHRI